MWLSFLFQVEAIFSVQFFPAQKCFPVLDKPKLHLPTPLSHPHRALELFPSPMCGIRTISKSATMEVLKFNLLPSSLKSTSRTSLLHFLESLVTTQTMAINPPQHPLATHLHILRNLLPLHPLDMSLCGPPTHHKPNYICPI